MAGVFGRLANLWRGFLSIWISDVEKAHPEIAYENAINSMVEKYTKLKTATAAIIRRREELDERMKKASADMAQTEAELAVAVETNQDDLAVVLIQKKNQLSTDITELRAELDSAQKDADSAKTSLLSVQSEIRKLKSERESMLAKMQSAQARIKIQEQIDGLSVDAEVKALDNVREHIKTTIAEANLGRELGDSSLDARLAALRNQAGDVQAKQQLAELKAKTRRAAGEPEPENHVAGHVHETHAVREALHHRRHPRGHRLRRLDEPGRAPSASGPSAGRRPRRRTRRRSTPTDFNALKNAPGRSRPQRRARPACRRRTSAGAGKLSRPLVVAINTWAGHAPGIVFNGGLEPGPASQYKQKYGMDVKFVLIEDPAAKLAAFRKGDVDIMWDTVDNWAREASVLAEQNAAGQVDPHAGLVARRRRHRVAVVDQVDRGPQGQEDRVHAVHAVALPAAVPARAVGPVARGPHGGREGDRVHAGRARPRPRCSRRSRWTRR